jgi:ribonucleoside-diphosphate reductase alpha chain
MVQHGYTSTEISAIPSVEDVQDIVESILIEEGLSDTAKSYILYRHERRKILEERMNLNVNGVDKAFNVNSLLLLRDKNNKIDQEMVLRC